ncbi:hypothetical protein [Streptomyces tateyamensis]|nr:hypothetical protein [Streptomyces tateyamensis]
MITKLTGQTSVVASLSGVLGGLGLDAIPGGVAGGASASCAGLLSASLAPSVLGTGVETGLFLGWGEVSVDSVRVMRDERPTKAPKAVAVAAEHGAYLRAGGAGAAKQDEQLINQAKAAFAGAEAVRSRAFRGPEPWRERT